MADTNAAAPNVQQEAIEKFYADKYATVGHLDNKGDYADLYTYVQVYRVAQKRVSNRASADEVHSYMIQHADELHLPTDLKSLKKLQALRGYASRYSGSNTEVATPAQVQGAYMAYEQDRLDKRDANTKKKKDAEKEIAKHERELKRQKSKSAKNWWGKFFSHLGRAAIAVAGLVLLGSVGAGVGLFAAASTGLSIGVIAGSSVLGVIGFRALGNVIKDCDLNMTEAKTEISSLKKQIAKLKNEDVFIAEQALEGIAKKEESDANKQLTAHPLYTAEMQAEDAAQAQREMTAQNQGQNNNQRTNGNPQHTAGDAENVGGPAGPSGGNPQNNAGRQPVQPTQPVRPQPSVPAAELENARKMLLNDLTSSAYKDKPEEAERAIVQNLNGKLFANSELAQQGINDELFKKEYSLYLDENGLQENNGYGATLDSLASLYFDNNYAGDYGDAQDILYMSTMSLDEINKYAKKVTPEQKRFIDNLAYKIREKCETENHGPRVDAAQAYYDKKAKGAQVEFDDKQNAAKTIQRKLGGIDRDMLLASAGNESQFAEDKKYLLTVLTNPEMLAMLSPQEQDRYVAFAYDFALARSRASIAKKDKEYQSKIDELSKKGGLFEKEVAKRVQIVQDLQSKDPSKLNDAELEMLFDVVNDNNVIKNLPEGLDRSSVVQMIYSSVSVKTNIDKKHRLYKSVEEIKKDPEYKKIEKEEKENKEKSAFAAEYATYSDEFIDLKPENCEKLLEFANNNWDNPYLTPEMKGELKKKVAVALNNIDVNNKDSNVLTLDEVDEIDSTGKPTGKKVTNTTISPEYSAKISKIIAEDEENKKKYLADIIAYNKLTDEAKKSAKEPQLEVSVTRLAGDMKHERLTEEANKEQSDYNNQLKEDLAIEAENSGPAGSDKVLRRQMRLAVTRGMDDKTISKTTAELTELLKNDKNFGKNPRDKMLIRTYLTYLTENGKTAELKKISGKHKRQFPTLSEEDKNKALNGTGKAGDEMEVGFNADQTRYEEAANRLNKRRAITSRDEYVANESVTNPGAKSPLEVKYVSDGNNHYYATIQDLMKQKETTYKLDSDMQKEIDKKIDWIIDSMEKSGLKIDVEHARHLDNNPMSQEELDALNHGVLLKKRREILANYFTHDDKTLQITGFKDEKDLAKIEQLIDRMKKAEQGLDDKDKTDFTAYEANITLLKQKQADEAKAQAEAAARKIEQEKIANAENFMNTKANAFNVNDGNVTAANKYKQAIELYKNCPEGEAKQQLFNYLVDFRRNADMADKAASNQTIGIVIDKRGEEIDKLREENKDLFQEIDAQICTNVMQEAINKAEGLTIDSMTPELYSEITDLLAYVEDKQSGTKEDFSLGELDEKIENLIKLLGKYEEKVEQDRITAENNRIAAENAAKVQAEVDAITVPYSGNTGNQIKEYAKKHVEAIDKYPEHRDQIIESLARFKINLNNKYQNPVNRDVMIDMDLRNLDEGMRSGLADDQYETINGELDSKTYALYIEELKKTALSGDKVLSSEQSDKVKQLETFKNALFKDKDISELENQNSDVLEQVDARLYESEIEQLHAKISTLDLKNITEEQLKDLQKSIDYAESKLKTANVADATLIRLDSKVKAIKEFKSECERKLTVDKFWDDVRKDQEERDRLAQENADDLQRDVDNLREDIFGEKQGPQQKAPSEEENVLAWADKIYNEDGTINKESLIESSGWLPDSLIARLQESDDMDPKTKEMIVSRLMDIIEVGSEDAKESLSWMPQTLVEAMKLDLDEGTKNKLMGKLADYRIDSAQIKDDKGSSIGKMAFDRLRKSDKTGENDKVLSESDQFILDRFRKQIIGFEKLGMNEARYQAIENTSEILDKDLDLYSVLTTDEQIELAVLLAKAKEQAGKEKDSNVEEVVPEVPDVPETTAEEIVDTPESIDKYMSDLKALADSKDDLELSDEDFAKKKKIIKMLLDKEKAGELKISDKDLKKLKSAMRKVSDYGKAKGDVELDELLSEEQAVEGTEERAGDKAQKPTARGRKKKVEPVTSKVEVKQEQPSSGDKKVVPFGAMNLDELTDEESQAYAEHMYNESGMIGEYDPHELARDLESGKKKFKMVYGSNKLKLEEEKYDITHKAKPKNPEQSEK